MNLLKEARIDTIYKGDTATANTNVDATTLIDTAGYESVLLISTVQDVTGGISTGGYQLLPRHSAVNTSTTGITDLGSTCVAGTSNSLDTGNIGDIIAIDIYRPSKRYLSVSIDKPGNGKSLAGPVVALRYNPSVAPTSQMAANVIESKLVISPTT